MNDAVPLPKKMPPQSLDLRFAGEIILPKNSDRTLNAHFQRFELLFEAFANMERNERILNYKFLNALMLTSHAKKAPSKSKKIELFDFKNKLFC